MHAVCKPKKPSSCCLMGHTLVPLLHNEILILAHAVLSVTFSPLLSFLLLSLQPACCKWSWWTMNGWRNTVWKCFTRKERTSKLCTDPVWPITTSETSRRPCITWRSHTNRSHQVRTERRTSIELSLSVFSNDEHADLQWHWFVRPQIVICLWACLPDKKFYNAVKTVSL